MNTLPQPTKYFLYIRKSTDEEDRQVLSLEAQLAELKEYAEKESLEIIETFVEKKTAKEPGREIFNQMLSEIEKGNAEGILAWHPFMSTLVCGYLRCRGITKQKVIFNPVGQIPLTALKYFIAFSTLSRR